MLIGSGFDVLEGIEVFFLVVFVIVYDYYVVWVFECDVLDYLVKLVDVMWL